MFQWSWWKISTTFICIHEDSNNTNDSNLEWKQVYGGLNKEVRCLFSLSGIPQTRQSERYPNWFQQLPAETLLSLSEDLEMSGAANRRCLRREKRNEPTEITVSDLFTQMLDYQWPSWVGFHCRARYNQHPWKQCCLQGKNVQLDDRNGCFPLDYPEMLQPNQCLSSITFAKCQNAKLQTSM